MDLTSLLSIFSAALSLHQRRLPLQLNSWQIAAEQLLLHTLSSREGVSQSDHYQLSCLLPDDNISLKSLLGVAPAGMCWMPTSAK